MIRGFFLMWRATNATVCSRVLLGAARDVVLLLDLFVAGFLVAGFFVAFRAVLVFDARRVAFRAVRRLSTDDRLVAFFVIAQLPLVPYSSRSVEVIIPTHPARIRSCCERE